MLQDMNNYPPQLANLVSLEVIYLALKDDLLKAQVGTVGIRLIELFLLSFHFFFSLSLSTILSLSLHYSLSLSLPFFLSLSISPPFSLSIILSLSLPLSLYLSLSFRLF